MRIPVRVEDEAVRDLLSRLPSRFAGRPANLAMAEGVAEAVREHLRAKNQEPNKLNAPKTNFYSQARDATFTEATASEAMVYIAKDGMRQRYHGGPIVPVKAKALTIPVHPAAHGRPASEFGAELRLVVLNRGNLVGLLKAGKAPDSPVLFLLVKQVKQDPDPSVLPSDEQMAQAAVEGLKELVA